MKRFNNPKYQKLLIMMSEKEHHIEQLAKDIDANSGHLRNVLDDWTKEGIVNKSRPGRDYVITLTEKGEAISQKCAELWQIIEHYKPKEKPADNSNKGKDQDKDKNKNEGSNNGKQ